MAIKDEFKTGSLFSQATQAARMVASPGHLRDMFNGFAFPTLSNGVSTRVRTVPDSVYSTVHIMISAGARNDPLGREGTAHLLEHLIFTQNAETMREMDVDLKARGGQITAYTNAGWTRYELRILNEGDNVDYAVKLLSRKVFGAQFDPDQVAREKVVVLDERRVQEERYRKDVVAGAINLALGSPWLLDAVIGNAETLAAISPQDLTDFRRAYYTGPNVTVEYTGPEKPLTAVTMIQKYFGAIPEHKAPEFVERPVVDMTNPGGREEIRHDPDAVQSEYAMAIPLTSKIEQMDERTILAAYLNEKIHQTMRGSGDRHAYSQGVMANGNGNGGMCILLSGSGTPEAGSLALRSFAGYLRELAAGQVDADILAAAIGTARMDRARSNLQHSKGDMYIERPEKIHERNIATDQAYAAVTPEKLVNMVRQTLVCGAPGLCLHGNTDGVARLADILPLLPGSGAAVLAFKNGDRSIA